MTDVVSLPRTGAEAATVSEGASGKQGGEADAVIEMLAVFD